MTDVTDYDHPIQIAQGIYWVGFQDQASKLSCNPYLVVQETSAILIDSGSRSDFPVVMMKILQTGIDPRQIVKLIYHHYDPDLCGSMPNFIDMLDHLDLKIITEDSTRAFISFYISQEYHRLLETIQEHSCQLNLNGRLLDFFKTPYCHSPGSFVTYDQKTRTLFTSDLFGSAGRRSDVFLKLTPECYVCRNRNDCRAGLSHCPVSDILDFHKNLFPSTKALRHSMAMIQEIPVSQIAPQHGNIIRGNKDISLICHELAKLENVGIDGIL